MKQNVHPILRGFHGRTFYIHVVLLNLISKNITYSGVKNIHMSLVKYWGKASAHQMIKMNLSIKALYCSILPEKTSHILLNKCYKSQSTRHTIPLKYIVKNEYNIVDIRIKRLNYYRLNFPNLEELEMSTQETFQCQYMIIFICYVPTAHHTDFTVRFMNFTN